MAPLDDIVSDSFLLPSDRSQISPVENCSADFHCPDYSEFYFSNTDSLHNLVENGLNDIYSKRNIYKNTVDLFYSEIKRKLKLTIDNLNYISISIPSKEQQEILHSFFATAGVKLEKLFLKYEIMKWRIKYFINLIVLV